MIETKTEDYKSHKHSYNVYVEINSKTKLGQDLLEQYHKQAKKQYIDIGRIGYHDNYGRYVIDHYSLFELIAVPKLIISVTEKAIDKAGRDEYKLRTYMSKFGQLNFLLLVDRNNAELILVENIYIENLNHKENYETLIYKLRYSSNRPVPLREIFFKFGIKANPDDYGRSFKEEVSINNLIVAKAKADLTLKLANTIASSVNQKALVTSLNYLNKEGTYGKKVTKEYSKKVSSSKELNNLSASPKLENTLNNVLVKTLEQQTTKADVKDKTNFKLYKKVLDVELTSHSEVKKEVKMLNTKQNLKEFMLSTYQKPSAKKEDQEKINEEKFKTFEKIIDKQYSKKPNKEQTKPIEEDFKAKDIKITKTEDFFDFNYKKIDIDFNLERFNAKEDPRKKQINKQLEKLEKKQEKKQEKQLKAQNKNIKVLNAECDLDEEFERSKLTLGILPTDSKRKKKKALKLFFSEDSKKQNKKVKTKEIVKNENYQEQDNKINILEKIEKQIRTQKLNKQPKPKNKKEKTKRNLKIAANNLENNNLNNSETFNISAPIKTNSKTKTIGNQPLNNQIVDTNSFVEPNNLEDKIKNKKGKISLFSNITKKQKPLQKEEQFPQTKNAKAVKENKLNKQDKQPAKNQSVINNLKNEIIQKLDEKKKKKSTADTLDLDDNKTKPNKTKTETTKKTEDNKLTNPEHSNSNKVNAKTTQSAVNSAKSQEISESNKKETQRVSENLEIKQSVIDNIKKEKSKKTIQNIILDEDTKVISSKQKTEKSAENLNSTNSFESTQKSFNQNQVSIVSSHNNQVKKRKPIQDIEREM